VNDFLGKRESVEVGEWPSGTGCKPVITPGAFRV